MKQVHKVKLLAFGEVETYWLKRLIRSVGAVLLGGLRLVRLFKKIIYTIV